MDNGFYSNMSKNYEEFEKANESMRAYIDKLIDKKIAERFSQPMVRETITREHKERFIYLADRLDECVLTSVEHYNYSHYIISKMFNVVRNRQVNVFDIMTALHEAFEGNSYLKEEDKTKLTELLGEYTSLDKVLDLVDTELSAVLL